MFKIISLYRTQLILIGFFTFVIIHGYCQTQTYNVPLAHTSAIQKNLNNPASLSSSKITFEGNYHAYVGSFSDVNNTLLNLQYQLQESRAITAAFVGEKTSDFFSRLRFYVGYQEQISLNKRSKLTAGIHLGAVNFVMKPIGFTSGGSDWGFDMSAGLELNTEQLRVGAVAHQLPNSTVQPILFQFELARFYDLYASYEIQLSPLINYSPELRARINTLNDLFILSNVFTYNDKHGINMSYAHSQGLFFQGFASISTKNTHAAKFIFSYFQPLQTTLQQIQAQQYEIGITITIDDRSTL